MSAMVRNVDVTLADIQEACIVQEAGTSQDAQAGALLVVDRVVATRLQPTVPHIPARVVCVRWTRAGASIIFLSGTAR